ncbi:MAG TPA: hypothetical protein VGD65_24975 [Chryseosolibacter sp.]
MDCIFRYHDYPARDNDCLAFKTLDVQLHDTYYVVPLSVGGIIIFLIQMTFRGAVNAAGWLIERSVRLAKVVLVANTILLVSWLFLLGRSVISVYHAYEWYPALDISNYLAIIVLMLIVLIQLLVLERRAFLRLRPHRMFEE